MSGCVSQYSFSHLNLKIHRHMLGKYSSYSHIESALLIHDSSDSTKNINRSISVFILSRVKE